MSAQLQLFESRDTADRWSVRVSRRARRLSVRVYPGGRVEVVVPPGASASTVQRFIGTHREWIDRRVEDLSAHPLAAQTARPSLIDLPGLGLRVAVEYERHAGQVRVRSVGHERLVVSGQVDDEKRVAAALRTWVMQQALRYFAAQLEALSASTGLRFARVQIRRQRTRWGSCSARGTISVNVCLAFLEPAVMRYLLVHELSHTRHMNHSARFWSLVEQHDPDYRQHDRELLRGWQRVPGWMFV